MQKPGKLNNETLSGRVDVSISNVNSTNFWINTKPVIDYILSHAQGDERPYLQVSILGIKILGLLDSGASRTILGKVGWEKLKSLNLTLRSTPLAEVTVANGDRCSVLGYVSVPIQLKDKIKVLDILVIPSLPHCLILGADFWKLMEIIPNLSQNVWKFAVDEINLNTNDRNILPRTELTQEQKEALETCINNVFSDMPDKIGCTNVIRHRIITNSEPIKQRYYPVSPVVQNSIDEELDKLLKDDIIEPSNSPWASPIILVRKKDNTYRFCVDYRKLNQVTVKDAYPLPIISSTLDKLRDARYLSTLDIKSAFHQIPLEENSKAYTAFTVPNRGLFQFKRLPFGLSNSPATWQRCIDQILSYDLEPHVFVYLDDIVVVTQDFDKHISVLNEVFSRLKQAGLTLRKDKCVFCKPELKYLGYVIDRNGLHVDNDKVAAILNIPSPKNVTEVRRIVGMTSWYRRFIPNFSILTGPLTKLTRKGIKFHWTDECENSFRLIKEALVSAPILSCPNYNYPFVIQCDASSYGLGAVLTQSYPDGEHVIAYASRSLSRTEQNYTVTELECMAALYAVSKFRQYVEGVKFTLITDHYSLLWLSNLKDPRGRLSRWAVALQQYDFDIIHRKGKEHLVPDCLSRSVPAVDDIETVSNINFENISDKWYVNQCKNVTKNPRKYSNWRIVNSVLYKHVESKYPDLTEPEIDSWRKVIPKNERKNLIYSAHDTPTSGHLGVFKTFNKLGNLYYWPKMRSDVARYVRNCKVCACHKPEQKAAAGFMVGRPYVSRPWELISVDLVGPLPRSNSGYTYILVVVDYFSKFPLFFPLRKANAAPIVKAIENDVFLLFGVPTSIIVDNGVQFRSREFKTLMSSYNVKIRYTANYHAQANPTERVNRVLKTTLSCFIEDNQRIWDTLLPKVGCAIRSSKHEVIDNSPYFVNFGREMILDGNNNKFTDNLNEQLCVDRDSTLAEQRKKGFQKLNLDIAKRLAKTSEKMTSRYNLRRRDVEYIVGQEVYKRNYVLSDASKYYNAKLAPKFTGPFIIHKRLSPWTYELKDLSGNPKGVWNVKDLKSVLSQNFEN